MDLPSERPEYEAVDGRSAVGLISCVVDEPPRFHSEVLRWYASLNRIAGVDAKDLIVHVVGSTDTVQLDYLRSQGVAVKNVEPFDTRHPHCNKISGALALIPFEFEGLVALTDTDVALLEDPRTLAVPPGRLASCVVHWPTPSLDALRVIFEEAELELPPLVPMEWPENAVTVAGNGNGGLYVANGELLSRLANAWKTWALWLLDRIELLGDGRRRGTDQVAMAMAMASEGIGWTQLSKRWNFPTMSFRRNDPRLSPPVGIHYHKRVGESGELTLSGVAVVDSRIGRVNSAVREVLKEVKCL